MSSLPGRKSKQKYKFYRRTAFGKGGFRFLEISILLLTIFVFLFGFSLAKRQSYREALEPKERKIVRLQILNASSWTKALDLVVQKIKNSPQKGIIFEIIEKKNYRNPSLSNTLVVYNREEEKEVADLLAKILKLEKRNVIKQKFADNYLGLNLKLLIGQDVEIKGGKELLFEDNF